MSTLRDILNRGFQTVLPEPRDKIRIENLPKGWVASGYIPAYREGGPATLFTHEDSGKVISLLCDEGKWTISEDSQNRLTGGTNHRGEAKQLIMNRMVVFSTNWDRKRFRENWRKKRQD